MLIRIITALALFTVLQSAYAQIYKCMNINGKITYSESECPSNTKGSILTIEPNVLDSSDVRKRISNSKASTTTTYTETTVSNNPPDLMTIHQKETRVRELNLDLSDKSAFQEKRIDAKNELTYLERNVVHTLSYELEQNRRNFKVDLNDFDISKRRKALSALVSIYANY